MSEISGQGYGDSHNWTKGYTAQVGAVPFLKNTAWSCTDCGAIFNHAYDMIPDIFEAIKQARVVDKCPKTHREKSI